MNHQFIVKNHRDQTQPLKKVNASEGRETLDVYLAPDGNNQAAVEKMTQKAQEWHDNIMVGLISRDIAWQASQTTIMKSLECPLVALTLNQEECNKIMKPVKFATLAKSSINRNYPLSVLHGPKKEGGLGLPNLYNTQGILHLQKLQQHLGNDTITSKLITVSIESTMLEVGIGRNIFDLDYEKFSLLATDGWIKGIWKFVQEKNIQIVDRVTQYPPLQRQGDVFLMEIFQNKGYKRSQIIKFNHCRKYLQALTLSNIMQASGEAFTTAYRVTKDEFFHSKYNWPKTTRPGSAARKLWRSAL